MSVAVAHPGERLSRRSISTLEELYAETGAVNFTPGWIPRKKPVLCREPRPAFVPAHWRYDDAQAGPDAAGTLVDVDPGDIVLTPGWCWHGHGHDGDQPAYWFDGLDVPLTQLLEPVFLEEHPDKYEKVGRIVETSPYRFRRDEIARRLEAAKPDADGFYGRRIVLEADSIPTMGLVVEWLDVGVQTKPYRTTANIVFHVMEGAGESEVGGERFAWRRGDTFVAPCGNAISHKAASDVQLFAMSDEPLLKFSNYYRMEPIA
jgi:gentisate 1,2-dioxygenase